MATTPEGEVKKEIRKVLDKYGVYYFCPVQFGYGKAGLDFHCCIPYENLSIAFFVEAKRPDGTTTPRQDILINKLRKQYNAYVFIVDDEYTLKGLEAWLMQVRGLSPLIVETRAFSTD